jgi:hypothetical protein
MSVNPPPDFNYNKIKYPAVKIKSFLPGGVAKYTDMKGDDLLYFFYLVKRPGCERKLW